MNIVGVGFNHNGKVYDFSDNGIEFEVGDRVVAETARGLEMGTILVANHPLKNKEMEPKIKPVSRKATPKDLEREQDNLNKRQEILKVCKELVEKNNLELKLIDARYTLDLSKLVIYFSAEGRVDFRELAKDLASHYKVRIELRQIGTRDETRILGGIGSCGRALCCSGWMGDFQAVSIKMAKSQNLSLNPAKISGGCGRLLCCLNFENETYQYLQKDMPGIGDIVDTPDGKAKVVERLPLKSQLTVSFTEKSSEDITRSNKTFAVSEVRVIKKNKSKDDKEENSNEINENDNLDLSALNDLL